MFLENYSFLLNFQTYCYWFTKKNVFLSPSLPYICVYLPFLLFFFIALITLYLIYSCVYILWAPWGCGFYVLYLHSLEWCLHVACSSRSLNIYWMMNKWNFNTLPLWKVLAQKPNLLHFRLLRSFEKWPLDKFVISILTLNGWRIESE